MAALKRLPQTFLRSTSTAPVTAKAVGDISAVFPSLSGNPPEPLPPRFQALKAQLASGRQKELFESWSRLLASLQEEIKKIKTLGSNVSYSTRISCFYL